jgi:hypothetical protein
MPKLSATNDEPVHLVSGYSYWQTRDFRINPEHPPLAKLIAAFPLIFMRPQLDTTQENWKTADQYPLGYTFLYQNDADRLLFWSRAAMILLAAAGLVATFLWARDLFGVAAGLFAATMYAFSPNLLAHGMLVTTDVPLAVFTVLTLFLFWKKRDLLAGLALGAAMASKFSGAFLPVLIVALAVARDRRGAVKRLLVMGAASLLVIQAAYLFSEWPITYFRDGLMVNVKVVPNYPFYMFGGLKAGGWWYYFPVAFALKATIPTLLALATALLDLRRGWSERWGEIILISGILFFLTLISLGANQIGVRYLLPAFPLIFIWASRIVPQLGKTRLGAAIIGVLLLWQAFTAVNAAPNYIPYFNEVAGGAAAGPLMLDDSNVDWGQGVKQAAEYLRAHPRENVHLYTFSPFDNPEYYGLPPNIPTEEAFEKLISPPKGATYIVSAHYVARMKTMSPLWRDSKPVQRIGESLWVYVF